MVEQCSICKQLFTSQRYLTSHLHQSRRCLRAIQTRNSIPTYNSTPSFANAPVPSSSQNKETQPHRHVAMNALGDFIVDTNDDNLNEFSLEAEDENSISSESNIFTGNNGDTFSVEEHVNAPFSIDENESFIAPPMSHDKFIVMIRIIVAVRATGAPLSLVDTIVRILKEEWQLGRLDITNLCTHRTAIRRMQKIFPSVPRPKRATITHERTPQEMTIGVERPSLTFPVFPFLGQLQDLLNEQVFADIKNLVVDPLNRWDYYQRNSCPHSFQEVQDGDWFQDIVQSIKSIPKSTDKKDFIFGIQGYVDKTGTDAYQRTAVEPLVFTLTLLTNKLRNSPSSWRVLALLPSSICQKQKKKYAFGTSVRNYHTALTAAFHEFIHLQKNPPVVRLRLGGEYQNVRAHLVWCNTIADGLANEQLVGRIQNRTTSPRLSRGCHCPQHLADHSQLHCKFLQQSCIQRLVVAALGPKPGCEDWISYIDSIKQAQEKKAAESSLQSRKLIAQSILKNVFGQHVVDLVWFHINQGPNPRGCFGSTPVDPMHAFEEGIVPNILSVILDPLSDSIKASLDSIAINIISHTRWDPDYPRMNFVGGFTSLTQLTADEKMGKLLLLWIIMQTPLGMALIQKRCDETFDSQRSQVAGRFSGRGTQVDHDNESVSTNDSDHQCNGDNQDNFIASAHQKAVVERSLMDYQLEFILPWINQMDPFHQRLLESTVYNLTYNKNKTRKHVLPLVDFLDRYRLNGDHTILYHEELSIPPSSATRTTLQHDTISAMHSIDCTAEELLNLLDMLVSFHATYKYGQVQDKTNFAQHTRTMMSMIKGYIRRAKDTKNWGISKFHELLHMTIDGKNFGATANFDAGKGESGLKVWAKLPSKTVRTRTADLYYQDMATRIYENRLIQLASTTLVPTSRSDKTPADTINALNEEDEEVACIKLDNILFSLTEEGPSMLSEAATSCIRAQADLQYPIHVYQQAHYTTGYNRILRATPNYRSSGPWNDWVMVKYHVNGNETALYPFQLHGFFVNELQDQMAVGQMGFKSIKSNSKLVEKWSMEHHYRIVDLQTIHIHVFAVMIPQSCFIGTPKKRDQVLIFKDRIEEWPSLFNDTNWTMKDFISQDNKKRKR